MSTAPHVMISSTFYDLRQVRADLEAFLRYQAGCVPLLSESASFPVEPSQEAIENCRRRVEKDADLLLLVVGGRYGSIEQKSGKSVTNLEYLAARAKGIPIYCFIEKALLANLPVWKANPKADFSSVVDNPKVFEFVNQVRSVDSVWTHEFELAQDIVKVLRHQFAHLLLEGLKWQMRLRDDSTRRLLDELKGEALRVAVEKPVAWEYRLFAAVLESGIATAWEDRSRQRERVFSEPYEWLELADFFDWAKTRMAECRGLIDSWEELINQRLATAAGPLGIPGDPASLVLVARHLVHLYRQAISWSLRVRTARANPELTAVVDAMSALLDDFIEKTEMFPHEVSLRLEKAETTPKGSAERIIDLTAKIEARGMGLFNAECEKLRSRIASRRNSSS